MKNSLTFKEVMVESERNATEKGFYEKEKSFGEDIALMHSELSEALEEYRNNHPLTEFRIENGKWEGVGIELADTIIRICECAEHHKIDLEEAIRLKLTYNTTRPHKHGGKKI